MFFKNIFEINLIIVFKMYITQKLKQTCNHRHHTKFVSNIVRVCVIVRREKRDYILIITIIRPFPIMCIRYTYTIQQQFALDRKKKCIANHDPRYRKLKPVLRILFNLK